MFYLTRTYGRRPVNQQHDREGLLEICFLREDYDDGFKVQFRCKRYEHFASPGDACEKGGAAARWNETMKLYFPLALHPEAKKSDNQHHRNAPPDPPRGRRGFLIFGSGLL